MLYASSCYRNGMGWQIQLYVSYIITNIFSHVCICTYVHISRANTQIHTYVLYVRAYNVLHEMRMQCEVWCCDRVRLQRCEERGNMRWLTISEVVWGGCGSVLVWWKVRCSVVMSSDVRWQEVMWRDTKWGEVTQNEVRCAWKLRWGDVSCCDVMWGDVRWYKSAWKLRWSKAEKVRWDADLTCSSKVCLASRALLSSIWRLVV